MSQKTHDFFVFYYEEDELAQRFVEYFVKRWETEFQLTGLYHLRDGATGKSKFDALQDNIERSIITVVVFTKGFMSSDGGFARYANTAAFAKLLEGISSIPCYIPIGIGLTEEEFPSCIRNVLSVAKFDECDWDQQVQVWRQLDNVLVENDLLTEQQMRRIGSSYRRYIKPAEKLMSDKFLRDCLASCLCNEYFSLGISLNIKYQRLEQIKKTDDDPFVYIFRMLVAWRDECERDKQTEDEMLKSLLQALADVERKDLKEDVRTYAEKFKVKREKDKEEKRRADAEAEAAHRRQQNENIQEEGDYHADIVYDRTNGIRHDSANTYSRKSDISNKPSVDSTLNYVAQEEEGNTSVMQTAPRGYVLLHEPAGVRQRPQEPQVELEGAGDSGASSCSLIPAASEDRDDKQKLSGGSAPNYVPLWVIPVTVVFTIAITAFVCLRYKR